MRVPAPSGIDRTTKPEPVGTYHMSKRGLTGREFFEAAAAKMEQTEVFYARRGIPVTADMRLVIPGRSGALDQVYEIYSVRDVTVDGSPRQEIRAKRTEVQR